jgi:MFS family permease
VVLACFGTAVLAWGLSSYGQAVFLAELKKAHGWSTSLIGTGTTVSFLFGACLLPWVGCVVERLGPRTVLCCGVTALGLGAIGVSRVSAPWQLYLCDLVMGFGWAWSSSAAIATTLAGWFDRRRGFALGLALCGASAGGFAVAPALVALSARMGFADAVLGIAGGLMLVMIPLILVAVRGGRMPAARRLATPGRETCELTVIVRHGEALRNAHFWSFTAPFALAISAQVGFIVHQVAFLLPRLGVDGTSIAIAGSSVAALGGRLGLGAVVDRLDQRRAAAMVFLTQASGLALMLVLRHHAAALYAGALLFGLGVGGLILLPAVIVQREFAAASFGLVVGLSTAVGQVVYAFSPALLSVVHDRTGGYLVPLAICIFLHGLAACIILQQRWRPAVRAG